MKPIVEKVWSLCIAFSLVAFHNGALAIKKKVCIIGAGRSGLAAIKLTADHKAKFDPIAFERNSDVGGLWIYRDDPELDEHGIPAHSGIYKSLKTNFPMQFMLYPGYHGATDDKDWGYIPHEAFLQYMRNYTAEFNLRRYIQFDTMVTKVFPVKGDGDWMTTTWRVETRNLNTNKESTIGCDAVMVCNGHYSKPYMPDIPGMETFTGKVLHSRSYRKPEDFANKTVIVLGNGNSAKDITREVSEYAKHVYQSVNDPRSRPQRMTYKLDLVRGVVAVDKSRFTLDNDKIINADTIIFCTGYAYDFPFLDKRSGIVYDVNRIRPLYKKSINVEHPSMAFIGLAVELDYGRLYYRQCNEFLDLLRNKEKLKSYEDMSAESKKYYEYLTSR